MLDPLTGLWRLNQVDPESGLVELRSQVLHFMGVIVLAAGLLMLATSAGSLIDKRAIAVVLLVVGVVAFRLAGAYPRASGIVLVLGLFCATSAALTVFQPAAVASLLMLQVIVAGVTLGWRYSLGVALLGALLCLALDAATGAFPEDSLAIALGQILVACALTRVVLWPLYSALERYWQSYERSARLVVELRDRQGELNRALKDRDNAVYRLEQLNRELDTARTRAERAQRHKDEFATGLSHELRTPVNLIIGFSEMMVIAPESSYGRGLPDAYRGDLEAIYRNACHISNLIDDVLDLARIDAYRVGLRKERTQLATVVDEAVALVAGLFADKRLSISVRPLDDLPVLEFDRTRVRQVLINLLCNAARFTDEGGVTIAAEASADEVVVLVADTGPGIAADELPGVFDGFHSLQGTPRPRIGGHGVGLVVSKRFVELHGGNMWVESEPGAGSTFRFSLPVNKSVAATPLPPRLAGRIRPSGSHEAQPSLLVVDDRAEVREVFERYLDGFRVIAVGRSEGARRRWSRARPRPVAVALPYDAPEPPRGRLPSGPTVRYAIQTVHQTQRALDVFDFLTKPVTRSQLEAVVRRVDRPIQRVLVVDDDPEMTRLLERMLRSFDAGYEVSRAQNGLEGLQRILEAPPDLALLDLVMPGLDGGELVKRIRAVPELRNLPVIAISGWGYGGESVVVGEVGFSRPGGLTVGEAMHCIEDGLMSLLRPESDSTRTVPRAGPAGSPASAGLPGRPVIAPAAAKA
jgi:signal transduction histidine kinase